MKVLLSWQRKMDGVPDYVPPAISLHPCSCCGRTFHPDALERHEKVCVKNASKKRKPFDINKQRLSYLEGENLPPSKSKTVSEIAPKKKDWRQQHEQFVSSIRAAREVTRAVAKGGPLPAYTPSAPNPDYVQCPYCERRFQEDTAQRHIPFCKEKSQRLNSKSAKPAGAEKLNRRTQYKPPALKKKTASADPSGRPAPPGSSLVMKQSNFGHTYKVNGQGEVGPDSSRGAGMNARSGSVRGSVVVARPPDTKKPPTGTTAVRKTAFSSGVTTKGSSGGGGDRPKGGNTTFSQQQSQRLQERVVENRIDSDSLESLSRVSLQDNTTSQTQPQRNEALKRTVVRQRRMDNSSDFDDEPTLPPRSRPTVSPPVPALGTHHSSTSHQNGHHDSHEPWRQSASRGHSASSLQGRVPLTNHGMPMSKYCYECGSKFPVPQAKFCCMCGTQRL